MLDPKPFIAKAEREAGGPVRAWARARQRLPGAALATPGLLCSLEDGLAFVEDEIVGPGAVTVVRKAAMGCVDVEEGALDAEVLIDTAEGGLRYEDVRPDELRDLVAGGGLDLGDDEPDAAGWQGPVSLAAGLGSSYGAAPAVDLPTPGALLESSRRPGGAMVESASGDHGSFLGSTTGSPGSFMESASALSGSLLESTSTSSSFLESTSTLPGSFLESTTASHASFLESSSALSEIGVGQVIARDTLRARLLGLMTDRGAYGRRLQGDLLTTLGRHAARKRAIDVARRASIDEISHDRAVTDVDGQKRKEAIFAARERSVLEDEAEISVASAAAEEPSGRGLARRGKRGKRGKRKRSPDERPRARASMPDPADRDARGDEPPGARAPLEGTIRWARWLIVPACAAPGFWVHPSVGLLGALVGYVIAASIADRARSRSRLRDEDAGPG